MFFLLVQYSQIDIGQCAMAISRQRGHIKDVKVQVRVLLESQKRLLFLEIYLKINFLIEGHPSEDGHCRDGRVHLFL